MADRFRVLSGVDARKQNLAFEDLSQWYDAENILFLFDFQDELNPILISSDRMEYDDVSFRKDLSWVINLLNELEEDKQKIIRLTNYESQVNAGNDRHRGEIVSDALPFGETVPLSHAGNSEN